MLIFGLVRVIMAKLEPEGLHTSQAQLRHVTLVEGRHGIEGVFQPPLDAGEGAAGIEVVRDLIEVGAVLSGFGLDAGQLPHQAGNGLVLHQMAPGRTRGRGVE